MNQGHMMKMMVLAAVMMAIPAAVMAQGVSGAQQMKADEPKQSATSQNPDMSQPGNYIPGCNNAMPDPSGNRQKSFVIP